MLGEHPINPVLVAKDLAAAREFYHGKLAASGAAPHERSALSSCPQQLPPLAPRHARTASSGSAPRC
jgi:hypothetical protein